MEGGCMIVPAGTPALLLALLGLAACTGSPASLRLPGGPMRGSMTHDEAMGARGGLITVDRLPPAETPVRP
jgi:hypothetical protein